MKSHELAALLRAHRGNAHTVANLYVLRQETLDEDDRDFLSTNLDGLRSLDLFWWLAIEHQIATNAPREGSAHRDRTAQVIDKLVDLSRHETSEIMVGAIDASRRLDRDAWADLAGRIAPAAPPYLRHTLYASARGGAVFDLCASIDRQITERHRAALSPCLSEVLFVHRRDDRQCLVELQRWASAGERSEGTSARNQGPERTLASDARLALAHVTAHAASKPAEPLTTQNPQINFAASDAPMGGVLDMGSLLDDDMFGSLDLEQSVDVVDPVSSLLATLDALARDRVGVRRQVDVMVSSLTDLAPSRPLVLWLAPRLASRSAWEHAGPALFERFIEHHAWAELCELLAMVEAPAVSIGTAFARALIQRASSALEAGDEPACIASLSALICLDPPSIVSRSLNAVRKRATPASDIAALADTALRLFRHGKRRDADVEGLVATVHALASLSDPSTPAEMHSLRE